MMDTENIFTQTYPINSILVDANNRLSFTGLLSLLEDAGSAQAESLGQGYQACLENNCFWVFSQQCLHQYRPLSWGETLTVKTWIRNISGVSAIRDYALFAGDESVGEGAALFLLLDKETHRPRRLPEFTAHFPTRKTGTHTFKPQKILLSDTLPQIGTHRVAFSDLDMNQHVNNTKYTQWLLDFLPIEQHRRNIARYEVNFLAQTFLGDDVLCFSDFSPDITTDTIHFQVVRAHDKKRLLIARIVFSA